MLASKNIALVPLFFCLFATFAMGQDTHEWTDVNGKKLRGRFLELTPENNVRIETDTDVFVIPLNAFSEEDQKYARMQQGSATKKPAMETPKVDKSDTTLFENREWTDFRDRQVKAKFVRMHEGYVILLQGATGHKISFYVLSDEDQKWLRDHLRKRGEEEQILPRLEMELAAPDVHKELDQYRSYRSSIAGNSNAGSNPAPGNTQNSSRPPAYVPPETPAYEPPSDMIANQGNGGGTTPTSSVPYNPNGSRMPESTISTPESGFGTDANGEPIVAANTPANGSFDSNAQSGSSSSPGFGNRFRGNSNGVQPGHCPNCRKELPQGVGPGDHCPRCKFYLDSSVSPGTGPPVEPWYVRYPVFYIGGGLIVAIGGLSLLSKKFYG